jgi:integrase
MSPAVVPITTPRSLAAIRGQASGAVPAGDAEGPLFRTTGRSTGTPHRMTQPDAYRMIQRRARAAGIKTKVGNHSLRATGITDYLKSDGTLEHAQAMANHSSPRTTKLYDRRNDEASLDEYEKVGI